MQNATKRPAWVGWIPAGILTLAIVGVAVTASVLIGSGLGGPAPRPTDGQVTDLNWSSFTEEGLEYIATSRKIRIDLSRPPAEAKPLGLDGDTVVTFDPIDKLDTELYYDLIVNGAGEYPGGIRFTASHVEVETRDGQVVAVRGVFSEPFSFRDALDHLEKQAATFGWTYDLDAIFADVKDAVESGRDYEVTFGPNSRVGVNVEGTISCGVDGYCTVEYEMTPSVR